MDLIKEFKKVFKEHQQVINRMTDAEYRLFKERQRQNLELSEAKRLFVVGRISIEEFETRYCEIMGILE